MKLKRTTEYEHKLLDKYEKMLDEDLNFNTVLEVIDSLNSIGLVPDADTRDRAREIYREYRREAIRMLDLEENI